MATHPRRAGSDQRRSNLPAPPTPFIGREQLLVKASGLLLRPDLRLLTLTGSGGTGKTRLALQVATVLPDCFRDGVFFVSLAPLSVSDLVLSTVAQAIGVTGVVGNSLQASVAAFLQEKCLLLVLDNFEHVVDAAPHVAELLAAHGQLKVLATSRVPLRLYGEHTLLVPPMALPESGVASPFDLARCESVKLFVERATAANPDFALTNGNAPAIAEICRQVDGLPLAIELAASRVRALSPRAMLELIHHRLPFLVGGPRDAPSRHQTLRNTIAWSYDLLVPDEQILFRRLAVFRGCTIVAAEQVCGASAAQPGSISIAVNSLGMNVVDGLGSLVENSLVSHEELADGQSWYVMLETVREFASERLAESGEAAPIQRRHILHYLKHVESLEPTESRSDEGARLAQMEQEHDNLRAALDSCVARGYAEPGFRLALALWWFWLMRGHVSEGRQRLAALLARFPLRETAGPRAKQRAKALGAAGTLASAQGDYATALAMQEEGLAIWRALGDVVGVVSALESLALTANTRGDCLAASLHARECLEIARSVGDKRMIGQALYLSANVLHGNGELDPARRLAEESLIVLLEGECLDQVDNTRMTLAIALKDLGNYDTAQHHTEIALAGYRKFGEWRAAALALANLGSIASARGDFSTALAHLDQSLAIQRDVGDVAGMAFVLERFAELAISQRQHVRAVGLAGAAGALRERVGAPLPPRGQARLHTALTPARQALGEAATAKGEADGRGMSIDEAVAFALESVEERKAPSSSVLSPREREVAALIARGWTNRAIATDLVIAEGTAAIHVAHILNKLGFRSRSQIAAWVIENQVLSTHRRV